MGSKLAFDDGKVADSVAEAARTHASEIGKRRAAQYITAEMKHAPGAAVIEAAVLADADLLEMRRVALREADQELARELGDDVAVFAARTRRRDLVGHGADALDRADGSAAVFLNDKTHGCLLTGPSPEAAREFITNADETE